MVDEKKNGETLNVPLTYLELQQGSIPIFPSNYSSYNYKSNYIS